MIENAYVHKYIHTHQMTYVYMCVPAPARALVMKYILYAIPILIHLDKI